MPHLVGCIFGTVWRPWLQMAWCGLWYLVLCEGHWPSGTLRNADLRSPCHQIQDNLFVMIAIVPLADIDLHSKASRGRDTNAFLTMCSCECQCGHSRCWSEGGHKAEDWITATSAALLWSSGLPSRLTDHPIHADHRWMNPERGRWLSQTKSRCRAWARGRWAEIWFGREWLLAAPAVLAGSDCGRRW